MLITFVDKACLLYFQLNHFLISLASHSHSQLAKRANNKSINEKILNEFHQLFFFASNFRYIDSWLKYYFIMTVNQAYESDEKSSGAMRNKRALSNVSLEKAANIHGAHKVELDTYFADERIHVPEKVSAGHPFYILINF